MIYMMLLVEPGIFIMSHVTGQHHVKTERILLFRCHEISTKRLKAQMRHPLGPCWTSTTTHCLSPAFISISSCLCTQFPYQTMSSTVSPKLLTTEDTSAPPGLRVCSKSNRGEKPSRTAVGGILESPVVPEPKVSEQWWNSQPSLSRDWWEETSQQTY